MCYHKAGLTCVLDSLCDGELLCSGETCTVENLVMAEQQSTILSLLKHEAEPRWCKLRSFDKLPASAREIGTWQQ